MYSQITTAVNLGMEAIPVHVEVDISEGMPTFEMVGFLSSEVREAKERVKTALKNSGFRIPAKHITVNLTPADVRKSGNGYDLPVAAAILGAMGYVDSHLLSDYLVMGEVGLNGKILPVRGVLSAAVMAQERDYLGVIVPAGNGAEASLLPDIEVIAVHDLSEFVEFCQRELQYCSRPAGLQESWKAVYDVDFSDIHGQNLLVRACEIAVSGMHNMLMLGPPGSGKTMAARRLPTIMPELTPKEKLELSQIYSLAGLLDEKKVLQKERPFRSPHHTATVQAIAGGGKYPKPGEISLAHKGILFLDELPEFPRQVLETLREPMEDKRINLSRQGASYTYPADFLLVAAMNPCPCGFYPNLDRCTCSATAFQNYINRISQALLNRMDLCITTKEIGFCEYKSGRAADSSEQIRKRVERTQQIQKERYAEQGNLFNSHMRDEDMDRYCRLTPAMEQWIQKKYTEYRLTPRSCGKVLRVARTIADMEESAEIRPEHLEEAIFYRSPDREYWRRY